jgi:hypothetical protein
LFKTATGDPLLKFKPALLPKYQLPCGLAIGAQDAATKSCCELLTEALPLVTVSDTVFGPPVA